VAAKPQAMTDLYETLGLTKGATKAAIRSAYRKLAKTHHPDQGGDADEFAALKHAHDILTDDKRRQRYDATGDHEEVTPDNSEGQVLAALGAELETVLIEAVKQRVDIEQTDVVARLRQQLGKRADEHRTAAKNFTEGAALLERLADRFTSTDERNILADIARAKANGLRQMADHAMAHLATTERAQALIANSSYSFVQILQTLDFGLAWQPWNTFSQG
jgi:curved DNA-binding protein CbpA